MPCRDALVCISDDGRFNVLKKEIEYTFINIFQFDIEGFSKK